MSTTIYKFDKFCLILYSKCVDYFLDNMDKKLINTLKDIGLSEKEAVVYMASLSLNSGNVAEISQAAGIKRTTVYSILESLKQRGLIRTDMQGWKAVFVAEHPEKLELIVDQMRSEVRKNLPEFSSLYNLHSSGAFIRYYEGIESVKGVYLDLLKEISPHDDYLIIGDLHKWLEQDHDFFLEFMKRRAKLDINIRILDQESVIAREHKRIERNFNEKIKILPPNFKISTNMVIVPHKVVINQLTPPIMAMVIENESIVQMNRELFEMIWKSTPD